MSKSGITAVTGRQILSPDSRKNGTIEGEVASHALVNVACTHAIITDSGKPARTENHMRHVTRTPRR